jgi:hypothetical protein
MSNFQPNDGSQFVFGEVPVEASVSSSQHATPAEIIKIAREIWKRVTESKVAKEDDAANDRLLEVLQTDYKDFNISFPIVLRWMVQMRKFSAKAFEKYLLKHATAKLDTREEFLELQAEYLVLLHREENRHSDENVIRRYRASLVKQLLEEDKVFIEMQKQVETDFARQDTDNDRDRRKRLFEYLLSQKDARASQPNGN